MTNINIMDMHDLLVNYCMLHNKYAIRFGDQSEVFGMYEDDDFSQTKIIKNDIETFYGEIKANTIMEYFSTNKAFLLFDTLEDANWLFEYFTTEKYKYSNYVVLYGPDGAIDET